MEAEVKKNQRFARCHLLSVSHLRIRLKTQRFAFAAASAAFSSLFASFVCTNCIVSSFRFRFAADCWPSLVGASLSSGRTPEHGRPRPFDTSGLRHGNYFNRVGLDVPGCDEQCCPLVCGRHVNAKGLAQEKGNPLKLGFHVPFSSRMSWNAGRSFSSCARISAIVVSGPASTVFGQ